MAHDQQPLQKTHWGVFPTEAPLYDPRFEHDACGIGFVADLSGRPTFRILDDSLRCLERLAHRGAVDADGKSGDGAGVLCTIPNTLMNRELERMGKRAIAPGELAVGMVFLPRELRANMRARAIIGEELQKRNFDVLAWRTVVHDPNVLGQKAIDTLPDIQQVLVARPDFIGDELNFDRQLYLVRRCIENRIHAETMQMPNLQGFHIPSFSCRTVVYKALVVATQLRRFYIDLSDPDFKVSVCVFHQRYATNTFPTWERAQPFRFMCHNGEINTVQGNANWMRAREGSFGVESPYWGAATELLKPIIDETTSDTGMFDNALELLTLGGRDIRHAMKMMVPQAWEKDPDMPNAQKGFFRYHASLMEPWDGPASLLWTDGTLVGFQLDRNGLRPSRYLKTKDGIVYAGSEIGAMDVDPAQIELAGKIGPGQMICADIKTRKFMTNDEIMRDLASRKPYREWAQRQRVRLEDVADIKVQQPSVNPEALLQKQAALGWTSEELTMVIKTMYEDGTEPVGSMGDDTPHAVLSPKPRPLFNYFKQRFAEVTNPPIDHLREDQVMSLRVLIGDRGNILEEREDHAHLIRLNSPILRNEELKAIVDAPDVAFKTEVIDTTFGVLSAELGVLSKDESRVTSHNSTLSTQHSALNTQHSALSTHNSALQMAVTNLCSAAEAAVRGGASILIFSDRQMSAARVAIPILLAVGAVHHHLMRVGVRWQCSLIAESGEAREVHHMATLVGYGASAINPYLALDTAREAVQRGKMRDKTINESDVVKNYVKACEKGLLKVMSKMGIAAVDAYCGAQIFEAVGLGPDLVKLCFDGTPTRIGGIGFAEIETEIQQWHTIAYRQTGIGSAAPNSALKLEHPGFYKERAGGEPHAYSQKAVHALQKAVRIEGLIEYTGEESDLTAGIAHTKVKRWRTNGHFDTGFKLYKEFAEPYYAPEVPAEPRDLMAFHSDRAPISLDEIEPVTAILRRFSSAAMSLGSLSPEAHETLAIAMTRLGGMSNSGEGGEEARRFETEGNSGIKQVASGRFGVTPAYLMSASELQIKMAQGSKPGEGGQIPGHKVTDLIAKVRHTVAGVALISPPPHHDIYSIEDLSQLIYDLRQINSQATISVKLVSQAGVGTIAAGVAKALADTVLISGHSGGTGASPLSSIKNAGMPWEIGLAETQQTLLANNLRGRVKVRADGGLRTGRDVVVAALLGADEVSFGTAPLIAEGCIMARVCHLNTCPVGVATQKPELRAKFGGKPEHVMAYLLYVAQDVREWLAQLGYRTVDEIVGRTDLLRQRAVSGEQLPLSLAGQSQQLTAPSAKLIAHHPSLTLAPVLAAPFRDGRALRYDGSPRPPMVSAINTQIVADALTAIEEGWTLRLHYSIRNQDRSIGAALSGAITQRYGDKGLPAGTIEMDFRGYAGQSFGAFTTNGMRLHLIGAANDYVGKGMRGGEISLRPFPEVTYDWNSNHIMGNTALYGATGGALFVAGQAGERFGVRNSGGCGVVEGVGDNALEYMTGGVIVVLGKTGRNLGAGMTGGMAFIYDPEGTVLSHVNLELVDVDRLSNPGMTRLVHRLLRRHYELTNSPRARDVLRNWEHESQHFRRVLPKDRVAEIESLNEFSDFQVT